ncbi:MAG: P-loop NTPase fold protein [Nitrospiraceae bacterium]|nr:P-loop NTPase fold protein [Nitrospiraceae bacterium]
MRLTIPPLEIEENEGFSEKKDIFQRKSFGEALTKLVLSVEDEMVICLDAQWGEGKTTFVKMWRGLLTQNQIKSIYFDSFKNDFMGEPFTALTAEIYNLALDVSAPEEKVEEYKKKAIQIGKVLLKSSVKIGIKTLTLGALDGTEFNNLEVDKDIAEEASKATEQYISSVLDSYKKDKNNVVSFQNTLAALTKTLSQDGKPLVFIVDELDRCRPTFALELLEKIKHIFSVPKIVFILVMNRTQMEESVKSQYGMGIDATEYLQKFINIWCTLPKNESADTNDVKTYIRSVVSQRCFLNVL